MGNKPCSDAANHISQPYKPTNRIASCGDATSILISHDPTSRGGRCFSSAMREEPGEDMAGDQWIRPIRLGQGDDQRCYVQLDKGR